MGDINQHCSTLVGVPFLLMLQGFKNVGNESQVMRIVALVIVTSHAKRNEETIVVVQAR